MQGSKGSLGRWVGSSGFSKLLGVRKRRKWGRWGRRRMRAARRGAAPSCIWFRSFNSDPGLAGGCRTRGSKAAVMSFRFLWEFPVSILYSTRARVSSLAGVRPRGRTNIVSTGIAPWKNLRFKLKGIVSFFFTSFLFLVLLKPIKFIR